MEVEGVGLGLTIARRAPRQSVHTQTNFPLSARPLSSAAARWGRRPAA